MRIAILCALTLAAGLLGGCQTGPAAQSGLTYQASGNGLTVAIRLPSKVYTRGSTVPMTVVATNTTEQPMMFKADSMADVYATVSRTTAIGGVEQVKKFPESVVAVPHNWTLAAGGSKTFKLDVPIGPDWPTAEWLTLSVALNGRPDVMASGKIQIVLESSRTKPDLGGDAPLR